MIVNSDRQSSAQAEPLVIYGDHADQEFTLGIPTFGPTSHTDLRSDQHLAWENSGGPSVPQSQPTDWWGYSDLTRPTAPSTGLAWSVEAAGEPP